MPYIHCCGSVMSPGVGFDMGGCNICTIIYTHFPQLFVAQTYLSVAMVAMVTCSCTSTLHTTRRSDSGDC